MKRFLIPDAEKAAKTARLAQQSVWQIAENESLLIGKFKSPSPSRKIAAFDFDGTLSVTKSGKSFAINGEDAKLWNPAITDKIRDLHSQAFTFVIFSNQKGIEKKKTTVEDVESRITIILDQIGVPCYVFCACSDSKYRKPSPGMWLHFVEQEMEMQLRDIDYEASFFCGDAGGRHKPAFSDFSDSDRKFALNCNLKFHTPEEFFLSKSVAPFSLKGVDPRQLMSSTVSQPVSFTASKTPELVILVGYPGCGKTSFAKKHLSSYVYVNLDTLKSKPKCVKAAAEALSASRSCVIDATHPSRADRAPYIQIAQSANVPVRCVVFKASRELAAHLNAFRTFTGSDRSLVPEIAYRSFESRLESPLLSEGFSAIVEVPFVFDADLVNDDCRTYLTSFLV
eukprot:ANDGO_08088.mRNA.1 Bifunctional polynucleotide phosphatase/kinase